METIAAFLASPAVKRLAVTLIGAATIALNNKLGLNLDSAEIASLAALILGFVIQSAAKEVKIAGQEAAAKVSDTKAAVDVLNGGKP